MNDHPQIRLWTDYEEVPDDVKLRIACVSPLNPEIKYFWAQGDYAGIQYKNRPSKSPTPSLDLWENCG